SEAAGQPAANAWDGPVADGARRLDALLGEHEFEPAEIDRGWNLIETLTPAGLTDLARMEWLAGRVRLDRLNPALSRMRLTGYLPVPQQKKRRLRQVFG